jgi:RNA polymerase sigma-70 factor (ECF subfamily)
MPRVHEDVVRRLAAACLTGDAIAIEAALGPDAVAVCDSGGRVPAPIRPVHGAAQVARLLQVVLRRGLLPEAHVTVELTVENVNGSAALVVRRAGTAVAVIAVGGDEDRAAMLWIVLNPAKLRGWHLS